MEESSRKDIDHGPQGGSFHFRREYIRYIAAAALLVVFVFVLVRCASPNVNGGEGETEAVSTQEEAKKGAETYQVDAYQDVNSLIEQYYDAYASGDVSTLAGIATPITDKEQSYIALMSEYIEEYRDLTCYTKSGIEDGSYLVSVSMSEKFKDVETPAPGLEFFYVRTRDDGTLYIDNLYSQFNRVNKENALDTSVQSLIYQFENGSDVIALQNEIQTKYEQALEEDADLKQLINEKLPGAITDWAATVASQDAQGDTQMPQEADTQQPEGSEGAAASEQAEPADSQEPANSQEPSASEKPEGGKQHMVYATDKVNVRAAADISSEKIGSLEKGQKIARLGKEGEWSKVDYGGTVGYIKSEFLSKKAPAEDEPEPEAEPEPEQEAEPEPEPEEDGGDSSSSLSEGDVVTLSEAVNVRSGIGESAEKLGTAYAGEKVTVVMNYAEGWTKVSWNGQTGYIKTEFLK